MKKTAKINLLIIPLVLLSLASHGYCSDGEDLRPAEPKNLKIGVIGPKSGEESDQYGIDVFDGVEMAAEEFNNSGGIGGKKIDLSFADNKGTMQRTMAGTAYLIQQEKVVAIIASPAGWSSFAPVSEANDTQTIFVSAGSRRHIGKSGPYVFRNALPENVAAEETIRYCIEKLGYKRYVIITSLQDDESSLSVAALYRSALQKFRGEVVAQAHIHFDISTKEAVAKLKKEAGQIDAVIFTGNARGAIEVLKELRRQRIKAPLIGSEELNTSRFLNSGGNAVIGTILYAGFTPLSSDPVTMEFVKRYRKIKGKNPSSLVAISYDSFMLVAEALKRAGTTEPSKVRDALTGIKGFKGVTGTISMADDHEVVKAPFLVRVEKMEGKPVFRLLK